MNPAYSVLFFTCLSGAGYGMLAVLGIGVFFDMLPRSLIFGVVSMGACLALIISGLLCSTLHLHHPKRAWRAFSQWRSSWLSREGVAAIATFAPAIVLALGWLLPDVISTTLWKLGALASVLGAFMTVLCTAMIYASLKPIAQWRVSVASVPLVPLTYFGFALAGGMVWTQLILFITAGSKALSMLPLTFAVVAVAWTMKLFYWRRVDAQTGIHDLLDATGLKENWRHIHAFDLPHTEQNYLQKEMGYQVARKHRDFLRQMAWIFGGILPILLLLVSMWVGGFVANACALLAVILSMISTFIERWLFFAEAIHTSSLYYDNKKQGLHV